MIRGAKQEIGETNERVSKRAMEPTPGVRVPVRLGRAFGHRGRLFALLLLLAALTAEVEAVDDCDHCTIERCKRCQFNTDGLTTCHECESCCLRQGRAYIWVYDEKYDDIWTPELWGEERTEQVGTAQVPFDPQPIMPRDSGGDTRFQ